ncbi:MAG: anthranilate synthase component I [Galactobacter sp.]|uniref:anthranilate synthase component I n=1 Tax=Galactobacter sp. TaxID=2676125 RepID=UPI0025BDA467|nr:anthranilate synthase component I [Galactobacter sp.]
MSRFGEIVPSLETFRTMAETRRVIPVTMKVLGDALTPVGVYSRLAAGRPGTFLMESAAEGVWSRYSFIGAGSAATLTSKDGKALWIGTPPAGVPTEGHPLDVLRDTLEYLRLPRTSAETPLTSGLVGFVGWEAVRHWERLPHPPVDDTNLPEVALDLVTDLAIHDNTDSTLTLVANAYNKDGQDTGVDAAYEDAVRRLGDMLQLLSVPATAAESTHTFSGLDVPREQLFSAARHVWDEAGYREAIAKTKEAIVDGEVFQAVVARRFELDTEADPLNVYRVLRATNPSPYMYLYTFPHPDGGEYTVVGSSPEALVTLKNDAVVTHPIAGSRPRGSDYEADQLLEKDLLGDEKERSEHLMLVDLSRNDLSKVCIPGTVEVTQFMEVERFSHIMHLVSNVVGTVEADSTAYDVLAATFPAGTLSGAPKPRALRLLDELEPVRRGVYGGVVGYFDLAGDMDMAIAIRTALLRDGVAQVQAGGGIVADSDPDAESLESMNKSFAPLRAAYVADSVTEAALPESHR